MIAVRFMLVLTIFAVNIVVWGLRYSAYIIAGVLSWPWRNRILDAVKAEVVDPQYETPYFPYWRIEFKFRWLPAMVRFHKKALLKRWGRCLRYEAVLEAARSAYLSTGTCTYRPDVLNEDELPFFVVTLLTGGFFGSSRYSEGFWRFIEGHEITHLGEGHLSKRNQELNASIGRASNSRALKL